MAPIEGINEARDVRPLLRNEDQLPIRTSNLDSKSLEENFRRLQSSLNEFSRPTTDITAQRGASSLELLARILGGQFYVAEVTAGTATDDTDDTVFAHGLGRIPVVIAFSVGLDVVGRSVVGVAAGGLGAAGGNHTPWTENSIYVRALTAGRHAFVVV